MGKKKRRTSARRANFDPDMVRMTFGEHLDELRTRMIRALIGIVVGVGICLWFGDELFTFILHSVLVVLKNQGTPANLMVMDPPEAFIQYLKIGLICGLILSGPWVLTQAWGFVAAGLYPHEQKFIRYFTPASMVLFATGVMFMFYFVLPVVLQFLGGFALKNIPRPPVLTPTGVETALLGLKPTPVLATQPSPFRARPPWAGGPPIAFASPPDAGGVPLRLDSPEPLTDDPTTMLFRLDTGLEDGLRAEAVSPALREAFARNGVAVATNATCEIVDDTVGAEAWLLEDSHRSYTIKKQEAGLAVFAQAESRWLPGDFWYDIRTNDLCVVNYDGEIFRVSMHRLESRSAVTTQYRLSFYISFVLALTLAFGIAFQVPIVVVFLVLLRIFRVRDLARARRYVIFGFVIAAAVLTPPDVVSQLMLAAPMILLFELGLLVSRLIELQRKEEEN